MRMSRGRFWLCSIVLWALALPALHMASGAPPALQVAVACITLGIAAWLCVLRLRDRQRSGAWLALLLVPVAGALWLVWELALRKGREA